MNLIKNAGGYMEQYNLERQNHNSVDPRVGGS